MKPHPAIAIVSLLLMLSMVDETASTEDQRDPALRAMVDDDDDLRSVFYVGSSTVSMGVTRNMTGKKKTATKSVGNGYRFTVAPEPPAAFGSSRGVRDCIPRERRRTPDPHP